MWHGREKVHFIRIGGISLGFSVKGADGSSKSVMFAISLIIIYLFICCINASHIEMSVIINYSIMSVKAVQSLLEFKVFVTVAAKNAQIFLQ